MRRFLREMNLAKWSAPSMLIATSIYYSNSKNHFSQCNNNNAEQPTPTVPANITTPPLENEEKNETKTEYELWLKEKEKCGLCRMFMASPCRKQFLDWARCVDLAKEKEEDFVAKCGDSFGGLLDCQGDHAEYFKEIFASSDEEESGDEGDEKSEKSVKESPPNTSPATPPADRTP